MGRRALWAGLLGFVGGAAIGLLLAMLVAYAWFDVFHLPAPNDDPKPGIALLGGLVPIAMTIGCVSGAIGMVRRVRTGRPIRLPATVFALAVATVLVGLAVIVS